MDAADFVSSDISWLLGIRSEQDMCTIDLGTSSRIQERVRDAVLDVSQSLLRNANASINCATKHPLSRTERESIPPPTTGNAKKKAKFGSKQIALAHDQRYPVARNVRQTFGLGIYKAKIC